MKFAKFFTKAALEGLTAKDCGNNHWRLIGGVCDVNFYPGSARKTIYVNGTTGNATIPHGTAAMAIRFAKKGPPQMVKGKEKRKKYSGRKRRLMKFTVKCYWCKTGPLTFEEATVDHLVPLARGGSNLDENLVVSCRPCNARKGSDMWDSSK